MERCSETPLHRLITNVQEKDKTCRFCNESFQSRPQMLLHRINPSHIKQLKRTLLSGNFVVKCLACNVLISDLKQAQSHTQLREHQELKLFLNKGDPARSRFFCESCGLLFRTSVALEIHWTLPPHELAITPPNLPNFYELVAHLGGTPTCSFETVWNGFCKICNAEYKCLDEFTTHIFSKLHFQRLPESACIVCRKDFMHERDRECHLGTERHKSFICVSIQELLNRAKDKITSRKNGYLCIYCMIWCSSWLSFELHLLHGPHYEAVSRRKSCRPTCTVVKENILEERELHSCLELTARDWERWIEEPGVLSGWCHLCGAVLVSPDEIELHLEDHYLGKIGQVEKLHPAVLVGGTESSKVFSCYICLVSFRSEFSLIAHQASFQHHLRTVLQSSDGQYYWCTKCGMAGKGIESSQLEVITRAKGLTFSMVCKPGVDSIHYDDSEPLNSKKAKESNSSNSSVLGNECNLGHDTSGKMEVMTQKFYTRQSGISCPDLLLDKVQPISTSQVPNQCEKPCGTPRVCSEGMKHASLGFPIVAAAALAPSDLLQEVLQSVVTVVANTLSATLPALGGSSSSLRNYMNHEHEVTVPEPDNKRRHIEVTGLEADIQHGFQSPVDGSNLLTHTSIGNNMQKICGIPGCDHNDPNNCRRADLVEGTVSVMTGNYQQLASVVIAAGFIPYSSTIPLAVMANDAPCAVNETGQESHGLDTFGEQKEASSRVSKMQEKIPNK